MGRAHAGRKDVDYDSYTAAMGGTSGLFGVNWQTNFVYEYEDNQSKQFEPNFGSASVDEPTGIRGKKSPSRAHTWRAISAPATA